MPNEIRYDRIDHLIKEGNKIVVVLLANAPVEHNTGATNATWPCTQDVSQHFTAVRLACQPGQGR